MSETILSDFSVSKRELKTSLTNVLEWSKDLEEKYQSMSILVESLSQANYKKDKKIQQLKKKLQKYKQKSKSLRKPSSSQQTISQDGKHVVIYQELIDLTEESEEKKPVQIQNIQIHVKKEPTSIVPPNSPIIKKELIEIEEEEEEEEIVIEKEVVEEDIEPALEPDSEEEAEPEPEMQPTEEPVLEKEEEVEEEVVEAEVEEEVEAEEEELYETTINGKAYYVTNETNGPIYSITKEEEVGEEVGQFVNGKAIFQESSTAPDNTEENTEENEEIELYQIKINGKNYAVENETDGPIYSLGFDGEPDTEVGKYVNGKPIFQASK